MPNHAHEAKLDLKKSRSQSIDGAMLLADLSAAHAQVHATLALAEQQRIANRIAFLEYVDGDTYELLWNSIDEALELGDQK